MMARDESAAERLYAIVRAELASGAIAPGAHVDAVRLAASHQASPTPVREALARLLGEGLLTFTPRRGYLAPLMTRGALEGLYDWSLVLWEAGARRAGGASPAAAALEPTDYVTRVEAVDAAIATMLAASHARAAVDTLAQRLKLARRSEDAVIERASDDVERILAAFARGRAATGAIRRFHVRRRAKVGEIVGHVLARLANGSTASG